MQKNIRIAIQKQGRLTGEALSYLLNLIAADRLLRDRATRAAEAGALSIRLTSEIELLLVRNKDIPLLLAAGAIDLGITGRNTILESGLRIKLLDTLSFGYCRLSIAAPEDGRVKSERDLQGLRIATSFPLSVRKYLKSKGIEGRVIELNGSVELAPTLGIADVIADLVCSGDTLRTNRLKEYFCIYESEACLVGSKAAYRTLECIGLAPGVRDSESQNSGQAVVP